MPIHEIPAPSGHRSPRPARALGIPLGDFGFFSTLLLSASAGFITFFGVCFLAILSLLVYNQLLHHSVNYADSYRYIAFPAGCVVLAVSFVFLMSLWLKRKLTGK